MNEFETKSGTVLHLKPVQWAGIYRIIHNLGGSDVLSDPEKLLKLGGAAALRAANAAEQLFVYVMGWGVTDDPPDGALAELAAAGLADMSGPHLARAAWVRFVVLEDDGEASELLARVLGLTWGALQAQGEEEPENGGRDAGA